MSLVHFFVTLAVLGLDVSVGSRVGCKEGVVRWICGGGCYITAQGRSRVLTETFILGTDR